MTRLQRAYQHALIGVRADGRAHSTSRRDNVGIYLGKFRLMLDLSNLHRESWSERRRAPRWYFCPSISFVTQQSYTKQWGLHCLAAVRVHSSITHWFRISHF